MFETFITQIEKNLAATLDFVPNEQAKSAMAGFYEAQFTLARAIYPAFEKYGHALAAQATTLAKTK